MAKTRDDINKEALALLRKWKRAGVAVSMGVGKTKIGLDHFQLVVNKVQRDHGRMAKALVAAPTKKIMKGWEEEAVKFKVDHLVEGLTFTSYRSLNKHDLSEYDVVYLDECHSLLKASHDVVLSKYTGYVIGLTGTPPKHTGSEKWLMVSKHCPIVYTYLTDEAIEDKILNDYKITVHLLSLDNAKTYRVEVKDKKTKRVKNAWWTSEVENYEYWTEEIENANFEHIRNHKRIMRMTNMKRYPTKEAYAKKLLDESTGKCIVFANTQDQADRLCTHSYHSSNKDAEENMRLFEEGLIDEISCVLQLSQGANIRDLDEGIILHMYGNERQGAQRIGRLLRLNPEDCAYVHILCFKDSIDVKWVNTALADFNQEKITWYDTEIF